MRLSKILVYVGLTITALSIVFLFLFGEFQWLFPLLIILPCCFSRSRFRFENHNEHTDDDYTRDEERSPPGETAPFVDLDEEVYDKREKRCPRCHVAIKEENLRYCPNCGNKLVK